MKQSYVQCSWVALLLLVAVMGVEATHGGERNAVVMEASSCEDLREIFATVLEDRRIVITKNMRCSRENWPSPVYVTNHTVIEGSRFGDGVPAIDWADSRNALVLESHAALTFQHIVLIQDFVQLGGLKLSFVTGDDDASVRILGTGVGIRSCNQPLESLIPIYDDIPRPIGQPGRQTIELRSSSVIFAENVAFVPHRNDNSTWTVCKSLFQCGVNSPFQDNFQQNLNQEPLESHCAANSDGVLALHPSGSGVSSGTTSNSTFAAIVALFTALCTTLVLLLLFIVFKVVVIPLIRKKTLTEPVKSGDEENPAPPRTSAEQKTPEARSPRTSTTSLLNTSLQLTDIELGVSLGKGVMSTVYKGYHNDKPLAVKVVDMEASSSVIQDDDPVSKYIAQRMQHVNVIHTLLYQTQRMEEFSQTSVGTDTMMTTGASLTDTQLSSIHECPLAEMFPYRTFHVTEFCNLGSLSKAMADGTFRTTDGQPRMLLILRSALDIAKGMQYLHNAKIVHGHLRPSNILLKGDDKDARGFICKVSDFGLTHLQERQQELEFTHGTNLPYRAPEVFRKGTVENGADVFSFGIILWTMMTNAAPFSDQDPSEIISSILEGARPAMPQNVPRRYERLIKDCWHADTVARPPFTIIIERLGKIITEFVRSQDSNASTPKRTHSEKSNLSTTDLDTVIDGSGSNVTDSILDTVEIHEAASTMDGPNTTGNMPVWEHFQSSASSPVSVRSEIVFPSFDLSVIQSRPTRACASWDDANTTQAPVERSVSYERQNSGNVTSKPSETVSLRYGMASGSFSSEAEDLHSNPSSSAK